MEPIGIGIRVIVIFRKSFESLGYPINSKDLELIMHFAYSVDMKYNLLWQL